MKVFDGVEHQEFKGFNRETHGPSVGPMWSPITDIPFDPQRDGSPTALRGERLSHLGRRLDVVPIPKLRNGLDVRP